MRIGTMQGRMIPPTENRFQCFPRERWSEEFSLASAAGLEAIEWIYDLYGADVNPLSTDDGIAHIKSLSALHKIEVKSLCADYFMDKPLVRASTLELEDRFATLTWLLRRCQLLDMNRIVLPFVDVSRIESVDDKLCVVSILKRALPVAEETGIEIHLETSLAANDFAELLAQVTHPMLKVNYDSGNSSSLGYNPKEEFKAYGARVGSVHIKDRIRGGATVPLGTGNADFHALFECLEEINYGRDFILQVARDKPGDEVNWAKDNRDFVIKHLTRHQ